MREERGSMNRTRMLAVLLLVSVFAAGLVAGAAINHLTGATAEVRRGDGPRGGRMGPGGPGGQPPSPAAMLARRLELTGDQREQVEAIFERRRQSTEVILSEFQPRIEAQRDSTDMEIRAVLTPEQTVEFDRIVAERPPAPGPMGGPPPPR